MAKDRESAQVEAKAAQAAKAEAEAKAEAARRAALSPLARGIEDQLASDDPATPVSVVTQAGSGHVKADIIINGNVVKTYPVALSQGRFYFSINGSFAPLLGELALKAHEHGRPGGNGEVQAEMLTLTATSLSVTPPGRKGRKSSEVDWGEAKALSA